MNPLATIDTQPWRQDAACAETDPGLFFAADDGSVERAKRICGQCDVRSECLETALAVNEMHGVWGGMAEGERRRLIRRRRREKRERERRAQQRRDGEAA